MTPNSGGKKSGSKKKSSGQRSGKGSKQGSKTPQFPGKTAGFWILLVCLVFLVYQMMYVDRTTICWVCSLLASSLSSKL